MLYLAWRYGDAMILSSKELEAVRKKTGLAALGAQLAKLQCSTTFPFGGYNIEASDFTIGSDGSLYATLLIPKIEARDYDAINRTYDPELLRWVPQYSSVFHMSTRKNSYVLTGFTLEAREQGINHERVNGG